jgi:nitroimidazol reductase NimA-like FMN-containing flavoprotein (pyridoxamine 5'-phosphate oxidase superfamily)
MITTLTDAQARDLLQSGRIGRLGCIANGEPYVVPINFYFDDNCAYSHSLPGQKITSLRENPRACLQVDAIENDLRWSSVLSFGNFEEIVQPNEREEILRKFLKRFPLLTPVESAMAAAGTRLQVIVFRIRIDRITGVSEG